MVILNEFVFEEAATIQSGIAARKWLLFFRPATKLFTKSFSALCTKFLIQSRNTRLLNVFLAERINLCVRYIQNILQRI